MKNVTEPNGSNVTSISKVLANRENAKKSTGPKSLFGKSRVSGNALKHGLHSSKHVIPTESVQEYEKYRDSMFKSLDPKNAIQEEHSAQIIATGWKIRRFYSVETGLYTHEMKSSIAHQDHDEHNQDKTFLDVRNAELERSVKDCENANEVQAAAFKADCYLENSFIKLSTIEQRLFARYHRLLETYEQLKSQS